MEIAMKAGVCRVEREHSKTLTASDDQLAELSHDE
jgi:hypothetical protein